MKDDNELFLHPNSKNHIRISKDEYYLYIARGVASRSTCLKRNYGAVIVNNDEIVSTGYNGAVRGEINCCDTGKCKRLSEPHNSGNYADCHAVHAEMNAIISASRKDMMGGTLYLYGFDAQEGKEIPNPEPCPICSKLIKNAGLKVFNINTEISGTKEDPFIDPLK